MRIRTYLIGRHPDCDIVVNDPTVSRFHAELVQGTDGRFYLTDRASASGSWRREGESWTRIRQAFIGQEEPIMLGRYATSPDALLRLLPPAIATQPAGA
jgi:pSer/pThr/pTyr-binding forkhead associated (FHA) protein